MSNYIFSPFPELKTERLVLRQMNAADIESIYKLRSDEQVNKFIDRPKAMSKQEAIDFIYKINTSIANNESLYWAITLKEDNKLIGTICLWNFNHALQKAEVGFELVPAFQGKGIMQEALKEVITYGFIQIGLKLIDAFTHAQNINSSKLLEKNNFIRETKPPGIAMHYEYYYILTGANYLKK